MEVLLTFEPANEKTCFIKVLNCKDFREEGAHLNFHFLVSFIMLIKCSNDPNSTLFRLYNPD